MSKCYVRDVSTISNQARLFSFRSIGFSVGAMMAPIAGSLFSRPTDQKWLSSITFFQNEFYVQFPYILVCFVVSVIDLICWFILFFFMEETLPNKASTQQSEENENEIEMNEKLSNDNENENLEYDEDYVGDENLESDEIFLLDETMIKKKSNQMDNIRECLQLVDRGIIIVVLLYSLLSFFVPIIAQVFPVWLTRDPLQDGLGFEETQLGILYFIGSFSSLCFQLTAFPFIDRLMGTSNSFRVALSK